MKIILIYVYLLLLTACASLAPLSESDEKELYEAALKFAINENMACIDCNIKYVFIGVEGYNIDGEFLSRFNYKSFDVLPESKSTVSCDTGIVLKGTSSRGYAYSIFEVEHINKNEVEVKWGHWYSCQDYTYKYSIFTRENENWDFVSTRK